MEFLDLIKKTRTIRRFKPSTIDKSVLEDLIECARYSPSGANQQKLKFKIIDTQLERDKLYPLLGWAGALKDWPGPDITERPSAYIVILLDNNISQSPGIDHGIAAQSMMLGARSIGLGCCMFGNFNKESLIDIFKMKKQYEPLLILALGIPGEEIIVDDYTHESTRSILYYRDENDIHHVPKRIKQDLIIE